ncbi:MAG: hypothetical protein WD048_01655 [Chitinophagales bacterium]
MKETATFEIHKLEKIKDRLFDDVTINIAQPKEGEPIKTGRISFANCVFYGKVNFYKFNSLPEIIFINFYNCIFYSEFESCLGNNWLDDEKMNISIEYSNCRIRSLWFDESNIKSLTFSNVVIQENVELSNTKNIENIFLYNTIGKLTIDGGENTKVNVRYSSKHLKTKSNTKSKFVKSKLLGLISRKTELNFNYLKSLYFQFDKEEEKGWVKKGNTYKYFSNNKDLNKIDLNVNILIHENKNKTEFIRIKNSILSSLKIIGKSTSKIDIEDSRINKLSLYHIEISDFKIYNLKSRKLPGSYFNSSKSILNNVWFDRVDFSSFEKVNFYRSTLSKSMFTNVTFPKEIYACPNINKPKKLPKDEYENYRQLKYALANQADQVGALEMHQKMFAAYDSREDLNWEDRLVTYANKVSNNHGISIWRALRLILILNIIIIPLLLPITFSNAPYHFGWVDFTSFLIAIKNTSLSVFNYFFSEENIKVLTIMLNPVHRVSTIETILNDSYTLSSVSYVISFLVRIINAWLIYQFVAAFRKFGKKL